MPTTTLSPYVRIGVLAGVLLLTLGGAAFYVMHGHSHQQTVTPPVLTHPKPHPKPVRVVQPTVNPLMPAGVHYALVHYPIVVVGTYNPQSPVENLTIDEARAGAAAMHVPFVAVDLLDDSEAGPLTALLTSGQLLPSPGFLIYKRPGTVVYRSDGYLNRTAVAQAVKDSQ
jgi:hypothetical protein